MPTTKRLPVKESTSFSIYILVTRLPSSFKMIMSMIKKILTETILITEDKVDGDDNRYCNHALV